MNSLSPNKRNFSVDVTRASCSVFNDTRDHRESKSDRQARSLALCAVNDSGHDHFVVHPLRGDDRKYAILVACHRQRRTCSACAVNLTCCFENICDEYAVSNSTVYFFEFAFGIASMYRGGCRDGVDIPSPAAPHGTAPRA